MPSSATSTMRGTPENSPEGTSTRQTAQAVPETTVSAQAP